MNFGDSARAAGASRHAGRVLLYAALVAILAGLAEALVVWLRLRQGELVRVSPHHAWMAPVANLVLFLPFAVLCVGVGALNRRLGDRLWPALHRTGLNSIGALTGLAALTILLCFESLHPAAIVVLAIGIAAQGARIEKRMTTRRAGRAGIIATAAALAIVAALAVRTLGREARAAAQALATLPAASADAPNVLLLILDTVRAKSLGLYGYEGATTPVLDSLAEHALVFERAVAAAPWTLPSHASMFTGRMPHELTADWEAALDATHPTLAEVLSANGYATAGFVANLLYTTRLHGLSRGFAHYEDYPVSLGQILLSSALGRTIEQTDVLRDVTGYHELLNRKPAQAIADAFLDWLPRDADRPFFAFLNFFDAHEPYLPDAAFAREFGLNGHMDGLEHANGLLVGSRAGREEKWMLSVADVDADRAAYEAGIRQIDAEIGRLLDALEQRDVLRNTIVIVTSDHGEQHGENGLFGHTNSVYMPVLHVPLLIRDPRLAGSARIESTVSLRDLPATILDLAGVTAPVLPGRSLAHTWSDAAPPVDGQAVPPSSAAAGLLDPFAPVAFSILSGGVVKRPSYPNARGGLLLSIMDSRHHYIRSRDGTEELYDFTRDPEERTNLIAQPSAAGPVSEMRAHLEAIVSSSTSPPRQAANNRTH